MTLTGLAPTVGQSATRTAPFAPIEAYSFLSDLANARIILAERLAELI